MADADKPVDEAIPVDVADENIGAGDATLAEGEGDAKPSVPKPLLTGDAEADEHDTISMPTAKAISSDLLLVNRSRRVVIHVATMYDMVHDIIGDILRNQVCDEISFQFVRSKDAETGMQGVISMTFSTTKQATEYVPYIQSIRPDLIVEQAPSTDVATNLLTTWKKERATSNQSNESMLIVKNLDPATASVDKLAAIFPEVDDIVIASQPDASNQGKLKGRKHAYLIYKSLEDATAALEAFNANPLELDGHQLIVCRYKEPPNHIPAGYLTLTARKLVLRHIARFKGLMVRAQEDPLIEVKDEWTERLKHSTDLIEKDDAARDALGLPKPNLQDFKDMTNLKNLTGKQNDMLLIKLKLADKSNIDSGFAGKKRPSVSENQSQKMARGGGQGSTSGVRPLMSRGARPSHMGFSTGAGRATGFSMGGFGANSYGGPMYGGGQMGYSGGIRPMGPGYNASAQRMALIRAAARAALRGSLGGWM